jgi:LysR family nitrogen assimilation transcriptional regulator
MIWETWMDTRRLRYFVRIADDGSLTKAAGVLRIAQPALSRQLRLLEAELGVELFMRTARGVRLTEEGAYLREAVAGPLRALDLALQNVRSLSSGVKGELTLGMPSSLADVVAKPFVLGMSARFPDIRLRVIEGPTGSLVEWLNRGIIGFALLEESVKDDRLAELALFAEPLLLVGGPESDLDPERPVAFGEAAALPLIVPSHHLGIRATIDHAATETRTALTVRLESDSARLIADLIEDGGGYAFLPRLFVDRRLREGRLRAAPIVAPHMEFRVALTVNRRDTASRGKIEDAVLTVMRDAFDRKS